MIIVTTPNGNIGKRVLRQLVETGAEVRAISHYPERIPTEIRARCEVVTASLDDADALKRGFDGASALFWCVPQSHTWNNASTYYGAFTQAAQAALHFTQNRPHLVTISGGGYGEQDGGIFSALHEMEDQLNTIGLPVRHLRCGNFMENLFWSLRPMQTQGAIFQPLSGDVPFPMVTVQDIAKVAVQYLRQRDWEGQCGLAVYGPTDVTMNSVAETLTTVLETLIRYVSISGEASKAQFQQMGASVEFADAYVRMYEAMERGAYDRDKRTSEAITPTTLANWATENLLPAFRSAIGD